MKINLDKILLLILLSMANGLSACEDSGSVSLNQEFSLIIGQKISIEDLNLEITFRRVIEDSRCPQGAECIWEGNGKVELEISGDEIADKIIELNTNLFPKEMDFERYKIQFLGLDPYPVFNKKIQPENYRIRVIVKSL
jgi:hypothetical protein